MDDEYQHQYGRTGHLMLHTSDFGFWTCKACNKNGDDWEDPKDFECVNVEDIGVYDI